MQICARSSQKVDKYCVAVQGNYCESLTLWHNLVVGKICPYHHAYRESCFHKHKLFSLENETDGDGKILMLLNRGDVGVRPAFTLMS